MYFIYSLLLTLGLIALSPFLVIDALRTGKYITGLAQRLGKIPRLRSSDQPVIWLHCVSVGEATASRTLVRALVDRFPSYRLVISTTTVTGQQVARELYGAEAAAILYFPIDWAWIVRRVLGIVQPRAVLVMETELWPRLFHECRVRDIPVILINGRISPRSFARYKLIRGFIRRVLDDLAIALMQSEQDAARIGLLGMSEERIETPGNLKFDSADIAPDNNVSEMLRRRFALEGDKRLIIAASTHAPEEQVILEAFKKTRNARLLIAPRHPERFDEVAALLEQSGLTWSRRSSESSSADKDSEVVLLDSVGEVRSAYGLADLAFVGGSISAHGGHNVLEPAALGVCTVTGAHTENFAAITKALIHENAIVQLPDLSPSEMPEVLASTLTELLSNESRRREIGRRAQEVCRRNTGATERTVEAIANVLMESPVREPVSFPSLHATAAK